jgi:hypothetical protein
VLPDYPSIRILLVVVLTFYNKCENFQDLGILLSILLTIHA